MPRKCECPECKADITHSYEPPDKPAGFPLASWYCAECELVVDDDCADEEDDYDREHRAEYRRHE